MAKISLLSCFTVLVALVATFDVVLAHTEPSKPEKEPEIKDPKTGGEIESYIYKEATRFMTVLEKDCPVTNDFKNFFERLKDYVKSVFPIASMTGKKDPKAYESETKDKAGKLFHGMTALDGKNQSRELRMKITQKSDQMDAINILKSLQANPGKVMMEDQNKKKKGSAVLTSHQIRAIKFAILRWEETIIRVVKVAADIDGDYTLHIPGEEAHKGPANGPDKSPAKKGHGSSSQH